MSRTMIRNLVLGLVLAASAGVQGLYAQRYPERRVLRAGNALYEQENYPEAEIRYRKAQEQSPTYEGLFNLADALYKQKRYDEALNILKQISRDEVAGPRMPITIWAIPTSSRRSCPRPPKRTRTRCGAIRWTMRRATTWLMCWN